MYYKSLISNLVKFLFNEKTYYFIHIIYIIYYILYKLINK